jgi:RNA polymerase sigma-70 factor, ECF subfamily
MADKGTDDQILKLFRDPATREQGFVLLVTTYGERMYWLIRRMLFTHEDADDALQETFVKIWENLDSFRDESALFSWIYRIASNEALASIRRKKVRMRHMEEQRAQGDNFFASGDREFSGDEIQQKLHQAIQQLPPRQRLIFNMRYFDDLKYEEMAQILNLTQGALKASYHHAVEKIKKNLSGH